MTAFHDFEVKDATGKAFSFSQLRGKVVLVVNVASRCGFTPQYTDLEKLHRKYEKQGFTVIAFPCNQFGAQEPGSEEEILQFCQSKYDVTFPVMAKIEVNGANTAPIYEFLKGSAPGLLGTEAIKWNFTKFLVSKEGKVLERFAPQTKPLEMTEAIERALSL